jgi:hypothetical protein
VVGIILPWVTTSATPGNWNNLDFIDFLVRSLGMHRFFSTQLWNKLIPVIIPLQSEYSEDFSA